MSISAGLENSDQQLFSQIAIGDEAAFKELFLRHRNRMMAFVFQLTSSAYASEEIIQDIFLKIWTSRHKLLEISNPAGYIFILTRNKTMDYLRKVATDRKLVDHLWVLSEGKTAYDSDLDGEMDLKVALEHIEKGLELLPEQKRVIFKLSRQEGWTNEQIAQHLKLSKSRVANCKVEVVKHLRKYLADVAPELALLFVLNLLSMS